ncbi:MAG: DNA-binding domain-containing protein, partial [Burkholderiales bacterium]
MNNTVPVTLSRFQDAFEYALLAPDAGPDVEVAALTAQPAFAVYRNTVMKGCIDALQANYPAVTRLVGDEWLRAAASVYVRQSPPTDSQM